MAITFTKQDNGYVKIRFTSNSIAGTDIKISATGTSASANVVATAQIRGWIE